MRRLLCVLAVCASACSGPDYTPAGPESVVPPLGPPNASGRYYGGLSVNLSPSSRIVAPVWIHVMQSGTVISGAWAVEGQEVSGSITGTATRTADRQQAVTGAVTWDSPSTTGGSCRGTGSLTGTGIDGELRFTSASIPLAGCSAVSNLEWRVALQSASF